MGQGESDRERESPHSVEYERSLLGSVIRNAAVLDVLDVQPRDFYRPEHAALWGVLLDMAERGEAIDSVTVVERITQGGRPDRYGGIPFVVELPDSVPSTANVRHYAELVVDRARRRRHLLKLGMMVDLAYDLGRPISEIEDIAVGEFLEREEREAAADRWHPLGDIAADEIRAQDEARISGGRPMLSTGFRELDEALGGGMMAPDLLIIAGRPAMGKTALMLAIATTVARKSGKGVGVFSLEMADGQLVQRTLADLASVSASKIRAGRIDENERDRMVRAQIKLHESRLWVDDSTELDLRQLRVRARRLAARCEGDGFPLGLLIVDYLQLMTGDDRISREQQVAKISRGLKAIAKELQIPIIAASQLSRIVEERKDKRPIVSDLRESGAIEQDADVILFPFRPGVYFADNPAIPDGFCEVIIAKNRNGRPCSADMHFDAGYQRFRDATIDEKMKYKAPRGPAPTKAPSSPAQPKLTAVPPAAED